MIHLHLSLHVSTYFKEYITLPTLIFTSVLSEWSINLNLQITRHPLIEKVVRKLFFSSSIPGLKFNTGTDGGLQNGVPKCFLFLKFLRSSIQNDRGLIKILTQLTKLCPFSFVALSSFECDFWEGGFCKRNCRPAFLRLVTIITQI